MRHLFPHLTKFAMYIVSGCTAAFVDLGIYFLFLHVDVWYIVANISGGVMGFITAFLLHKYVVFKKRDSFVRHLKKYFVVDMVNLCIITALLYFLVDRVGIDEGLAKFVALAPIVLWNFFIYKFVVYV